jgi:hypothetical protein
VQLDVQGNRSPDSIDMRQLKLRHIIHFVYLDLTLVSRSDKTMRCMTRSETRAGARAYTHARTHARVKSSALRLNFGTAESQMGQRITD